ncbi:hypothetical protein TKK_0004297 [Trichogramma kaykai]
MEHIPEQQNTSSTLHKIRGWVFLLVCFVLQLLIEGVLSSYGLFQNEWIKEFPDDVARSSIGGEQRTASATFALLLASGCLAYPLSCLLVQWLRYQQVVVSGLGAMLATGSLLSAARATSLQRVFQTAGAGTGLGLGLVYHSAQVSLYQLISRESYLRPRVVLTMGLCAKGLGTAMVAPLVNHLLLGYGDYRTVMVCLAGSVMLCSSVYGCIYFKPRGACQQPETCEPKLFLRDSIVHLLHEEDNVDANNNNDNSPPQSPEFILKNIVVTLIFACSSLFAIGGYLVPFLFIKKLAADRGMPGQGHAFLVVIGIADCFGRLLASCYLPRRPRNNPYCNLVVYSGFLIVCGIVTSVSPTYVAGNFLEMAAYAAAFGFTSGCFLVLGHFCLTDYLKGDRSIRSDQTLMCLPMLLQMEASLFGPLFAGYLVDEFVGADVAFRAAGGSLLVAGSILHLVPLLTRRWSCAKPADTKPDVDVLVLGSSRIVIDYTYSGQPRTVRASTQRTPCTV